MLAVSMNGDGCGKIIVCSADAWMSGLQEQQIAFNIFSRRRGLAHQNMRRKSWRESLTDGLQLVPH
jgi:hypothetical protein